MRPPSPGLTLLLGALSALVVPCRSRGRHTPHHLLSPGDSTPGAAGGEAAADRIRHARHRVAKETLEARPLEEERDTRTYEHGFPPHAEEEDVIAVSPPRGQHGDIHIQPSYAGSNNHTPGYVQFTHVQPVLEEHHALQGETELSYESQLIGYLLARLHRVGTLARPVTQSHRSVKVGFRMTLVQLLDFDETKQLLITNVWKSYQWRDENLTWDPSKFGGIMDLRLPPELVWTPDIVLYNNADEQYEREQHHELIAIFYNGTVKWIPSAIYKSSCEVDMTNFPFDVQTCFFKYGSWTYDGLKLDLQFLDNDTNIDFGEYVRSAEWDTLRHSGWRRTRQYPCCGDDPYPELIYSITLKRKTAFYVVVLVLPCLLLSCLTLVMFWFPPQRPDRTGLGMSLFSSFFVLLLILVQASPPTAQSISLLGLYYCVNMCLIAISTTMSAIVINMLEHKGTGRVVVPQFLMQFRKTTWWHLFFRAQGQMIQSKYTKDGKIIPEPTTNGAIILDERGRATVDWRTLATALDRLCFIIFIFCFILAIIIVFPR